MIRLYPAGANTQPTDTCPIPCTLTDVLLKGSEVTFGDPRSNHSQVKRPCENRKIRESKCPRR